MRRLPPLVLAVLVLAGCPRSRPAEPPAPPPPPPPSPQEVLAEATRATADASGAWSAEGTPAAGDAAIAAWLHLAGLHLEAERWEDSINAFEEARVVAAELQRQGFDRRRPLVDALRGLARANAGAGWTDSAAEQSMQAAAFANQLVVESPDDLDLALLRGDVMAQTGLLRLETGRIEAARARLLEAESAYEFILFHDDAHPGALTGLEQVQAALAELPPPPPPGDG